MAPQRRNKTDPRNKATPIDRLRGAAKQNRIRRVTRVEAGPASYGPNLGQTSRSAPTGNRRRPASGAGRRDNTRPASPSRTGRALPASGRTSGNTPRAQAQAGWARDRGARAQLNRTLQILGRGAARMAGVDRQSQAESRRDRAARGTRGEGVRVAPPAGSNSRPQRQLPGRNQRALPPGQRGGAIERRSGGNLAPRSGALARSGGRGAATDARIEQVRVRNLTERPRALPGQRGLPPGRPGGTATDGRIERVRVRDVTGQRGLPQGGQRNSGSGNRALPPSQRGGALATRPSSNRALPQGRPSARQEQARQRQADAARGTRGSGVRTGQPAGEANRQVRMQQAGGSAASFAGAAAGALLSPLAERAGRWLGRNVLRPAGRALDDALPGINSKDEAQRKQQGPRPPAGRQRPQRNGPLPNFPSAEETKARENGARPTRQNRQTAPEAPRSPERTPEPPVRPSAPVTASRPAPAPSERQPEASTSAPASRPSSAPQAPRPTPQRIPVEPASEEPKKPDAQGPASNQQLAIPAQSETKRSESSKEDSKPDRPIAGRDQLLERNLERIAKARRRRSQNK